MECPKTGQFVKVKGKSQQGKDCTDESGEKWLIEAITERVMFDDRIGVWLGISPKGGHKNGFRWVHFLDDENFFIELL